MDSFADDGSDDGEALGAMGPVSVPEDAASEARSVGGEAPLDGASAEVPAEAAPAGEPAAEIWNRVKARLRAEFGEAVFSSWFARLDFEDCDAAALRLSVPTRFLKQWIHGNYGDRLTELWRVESGSVRRVDIAVRTAGRGRAVAAPTAAVAVRAPAPEPRRSDGQRRTTSGTGGSARPAARSEGSRYDGGRADTGRSDGGRESALAGSPLDPRFTFDTFLEGRTNALALAAARQVAGARPGEAVPFNPLFVQAPVGFGKTHLLQAIAGEAQRNGGRRVLYLTAEHFVYRFVAALQAHTALNFKDALREIDLLIIDDMQFLQGDRSQAEFCHTLNALIDGARQVVVAGDRPPSELESLDARVRSRLAGGLLVELMPPDAELRRRILAQRLAAQRVAFPGVEVPEAVIDFVARAVATNGRDLEGAANRLVAHNQLTGAPISIEMAETVLRDLLKQREARRVRIEDIQRVVARHYSIPKTDLVSARRTQAIVRPRQIAMYLAKVLTPRSLPEIGRRFGGRDHTTVLHAVRKIDELAKTDTRLADDIELLKRQIEDEPSR
ncbi:chromosomal replication initiator protein DnaA [Pseudoxanthobacter sp. M-2]|uniref:chromosomal replication initiator protein DnaA n=1 Tax=Pseudoxanthobacter sp. M-2 TaxID=3078754 RepID=UPI0038FCD67C